MAHSAFLSGENACLLSSLSWVPCNQRRRLDDKRNDDASRHRHLQLTETLGLLPLLLKRMGLSGKKMAMCVVVVLVVAAERKMSHWYTAMAIVTFLAGQLRSSTRPADQSQDSSGPDISSILKLARNIVSS